MPRIPLFDIPNAPAAGPVPAAQSSPALGIIDMSALSAALQAETFAPGAFQQNGGEALGNAVAQASSVFSQLGERMMMSKNYADLARAEDAMGKTRAAFDQRVQGVPESEWQGIWENEFSPALQQSIGGLGLSGWARDRVLPQLAQFQTRQRIGIESSVVKKRIDSDRAALLTQRQSRLDAGDLEGAEEINFRMEAIGAQTATERAEFSLFAKNTTNHRGASDMLNRDPLSFEKEMAESAAAGKSDVFTWMQPEDITRYLSHARTEVGTRRADARQSLGAAIRAGEITDESTLRARAGAYLGETEIKSLLTSLSRATPYDAAVTSRLRTDIANYDPRLDRDLSVYSALKTRVESTVSHDVQGPLDKELWDVFNRARQAKFPRQAERMRGDLYKRADNLGDQGALTGGQTGRRGLTNERKGERATDIIDAAQDSKVFEAVNSLKNDIDEFFDKHPDASPKEATEWFNSKIAPLAKASGAQAFLWKPKAAPIPLGPYRGGGLTVVPPAPRGPVPVADIRTRLAASAGGDLPIAEIKQWEGFTPTATPDYKQTSIGYGTRARDGETTISEADADRRLREELATHAGRIDAAVQKSGLPLTRNQRAALISFDFNTGEGPKLLATSRDTDEIARRMALYTKVTKDGQKIELPGLVKRRQNELTLFRS